MLHIFGARGNISPAISRKMRRFSDSEKLEKNSDNRILPCRDMRTMKCHPQAAPDDEDEDGPMASPVMSVVVAVPGGMIG